LCNPGQVVSNGRLTEALWAATPPASAGDNLRVYIHRLRQALGAQRITGRGQPGYAVTVRPGELDAARFVHVARTACQALAAQEDHVARERAAEAIALWRGRPFADLDGEPALRDEASRLEHHLLTAIECRAEAELRLGNNALVITELCALVDKYPYH